MTPNLTNIQTIALSTTIAGAVLIIFFTALILLTFREMIQYHFQWWGLLIPIRNYYNFNDAPFPRHYVLPRHQLDVWPHMASPCTTNITRWCTHTRTMATLSHESSLEYLLSQQESTHEPRNATPGPSNVCRTPTPNAAPTNRTLWTTVLDGPFPETESEYPMGTWEPDNTPE